MSRNPDAVDITVGLRIRMRRVEQKISQEDLGEALGVSFQQVQKYEKGANRVSASRLQQVATALDVPVHYFFEGDGRRPTDDVASFMTSADGIAIAQAMQKLPNDGKQRRVIRDLILGIVEAHVSAANLPQRRAA